MIVECSALVKESLWESSECVTVVILAPQLTKKHDLFQFKINFCLSTLFLWFFRPRTFTCGWCFSSTDVIWSTSSFVRSDLYGFYIPPQLSWQRCFSGSKWAVNFVSPSTRNNCMLSSFTVRFDGFIKTSSWTLVILNRLKWVTNQIFI